MCLVCFAILDRLDFAGRAAAAEHEAAGAFSWPPRFALNTRPQQMLDTNLCRRVCHREDTGGPSPEHLCTCGVLMQLRSHVAPHLCYAYKYAHMWHFNPPAGSLFTGGDTGGPRPEHLCTGIMLTVCIALTRGTPTPLQVLMSPGRHSWWRAACLPSSRQLTPVQPRQWQHDNSLPRMPRSCGWRASQALGSC